MEVANWKMQEHSRALYAPVPLSLILSHIGTHTHKGFLCPTAPRDRAYVHINEAMYGQPVRICSKHAQRLIHTPSTSGINVYNSLTKQKEPLKLKQEGNTLYWYTCGPTVYDSAHIGHAR